MAISVQNSPLSSAANNIVSVNSRSKGSVQRLVNDHRTLGRDLDAGAFRLNRIEFPKPKDIKAFSSVNVLNTFGSLGGMIQGLYSNKLDLGGLVRGVFTGRGNKVGRAFKVASATVRPKPIIRGNRIRLSGPRAVGVSNSIFSGLDFSTGLSGNELKGSAAASASGNLAGSLLSGAIGKSLVPVPGLGFVLAGSVGLAMGGLAMGGISSFANTTMNARMRQEQSLEAGKSGREDGRSSGISKADTTNKQKSILNSFNESVGKFQSFVKNLLDGKITFGSSTDVSEPAAPSSPAGPQTDEAQIVEGGELPSSHPVTGRIGDPRQGHRHAGIDYAIPENTPVSVIRPGRVTVARTVSGYGNAVYVLHDDGIESIYGHLNKINVREGQQIEPGTVIGLAGSTGVSSGSHVHFELRKNNIAILSLNDKSGDSYFRFGGNVRVQPGHPQMPSSNMIGLELHADTAKGQTGLIASYIDPMNPVTTAVAGAYGQFDRNVRGGDLGAPKRGLNILETVAFNQRNTQLMVNQRTRSSFVNEQALKLFNILKNYKNVPITLFAGHSDVTTGQTGTSGTGSGIGGRSVEQVYTEMLAERVEQLAKAAGMANITYVRSIIANDPNDPNANWNRFARMRGSTTAQRPQTQAAPAATAAPRPSPSNNLNINYQTSYNQPAQVIIVNRPTITMVPMGGSSSSAPQVIPVPTGGGGSSTVIIPPSNNSMAILNKIQEYRLT